MPSELQNGLGPQSVDAIHSIRERLTEWYQENHRKLPWRETNDPYKIWVSEVMLQQTQVNTVIPYYHRFIERFPNLPSLAEANLKDVLKVWEGLGYYARARNLHHAAKTVIEEYHGEIPDTLKDFRKLPGVGEYIAAAVQSIAFDQPYAVVDGNVKRVLARLFQIKSLTNESSGHKDFRESAQALLDIRQPGTFNQAMMELGATVCTPANPDCSNCPLSTFCRSLKNKTVNEYPKRLQSKPIPEYNIAVGVIHKGKKLLITQRKPEGLLGGLWEFPGGKVENGETTEQACIREIKEEVNLNVKVTGFVTTVRHAYSHFKIVMDVFECVYISGRVKRKGSVDHRWVTFSQLKNYPFPKANNKFISLLSDVTDRVED